MAKYGKKAGAKVKRALHKRKEGTLKSGSGRKVKSKKQAVAIGLEEARREGGKVPARKSGSRKASKKKSSPKKSSAKKKGSARKSSGAKKKSSSRKSSRAKKKSTSSARKK